VASPYPILPSTSTLQAEYLTTGLHHIVTTQGPQLLSPTEPILPQIEAAIIAGHSIPLDTTPAAAHTAMAEQGEEIRTVIGGPPPPRVNVINTNGGLQGHGGGWYSGTARLLGACDESP
jgi:hypothetical protein